MSRSLNSLQLIGHVGQDPEVRALPNGTRCATFSLATTRVWTDQRNERQEKTEWHRCVVWNRSPKGGLANVVDEYVRKGNKLYVQGRIEYRQWQDKDNVTRYTTEINVGELILLGSKVSSVGDDTAQSQGRTRSVSQQPDDEFPDALRDDEDEMPF